MDDCYSSTLNSVETTEKEEANWTTHLPGKYFEPLDYTGKNEQSVNKEPVVTELKP